MRRCVYPLGLFLAVGVGPAAPARAAEPAFAAIAAEPASVTLHGPRARHTLLVTGRTADGRLVDLTRAARYRSSRPAVAAVGRRGDLRAIADGTAELTVEAGGRTLKVAVHVEGSREPRAYHFENDIVPLLSRFNCNSSGCHGKAEGQNGFKLSVFGFDPAADHAALTRESRGRRVFPAAPDHSLLLTKAAGVVAHGGGVRLRVGSDDYETVRGWIAAGTPFGDPGAPKVARIRVEPAERILTPRGTQQLRVTATYTDGHAVDVTAHARFQSNNDALTTVDADGLVRAGDSPGEAAVMASYQSAVAVFRAVVPRPGPPVAAKPLPAFNFIDPLVDAKLKKLNLQASDVADDAEYLRRVSLDVIGTLPTAAEARAFLADRRADKRAALVEDLMKRPEFADYWALKWADLLRVDRQALGHKQAYEYYRWVRASIARNQPLDQFARELLTAEGPLAESGPASFYKAVAKPGEAASTLSQVFLGVRIACAECHHHPYDRWAQTDYYGMQAFFNPVALRRGPSGEEVQAVGKALATHPRTKETIPAFALGEKLPTASEPAVEDARAQLADWMTAPGNPWFARNLANRTWAHFLGRGLVEPVDDVRATNPPTNPELLDALARHLVEHKFDFRALVRAITASRAYQTSSQPNATNERDEQNYSRALFKRIDAEVLLDMVCQTTGVAEKFPGVPAGSRAVQLWDSKVPHYFLKLFGRPVRVSACECERRHEPSVAQVLHVLNSPQVQAKLSHEKGTVAKLVKQHADDGKLTEELYLTFYARLPDEKERVAVRAFLGKDSTKRRQAAEDVAWSLMNTLEFVFNH